MLREFWWFHDPERKAAVAAARVETPRLKMDGTPAKVPDVSHRCARCQQLFKEYDVDHIDPVGTMPPWPPTGDGLWERYIMRMLTPRSNLQILCHNCHVRKTAEDRNATREV